MSPAFGTRALRVLVVGTGAVGRMVANVAAAGGAQTTMVGRSREGGGARGGSPVATWDDLDANATGVPGFEAVLVAVKSMDTSDVAERLSGLAPVRAALLVSLQNGLGNEEILAAACPDNPIASGALTASVERVAGDRAADPGRRTRGGVALSLWNPIPEPAGDRASGLLRSLAAALDRGGLPAVAWECYGQGRRGRDLKWSKLLLNIVGNGTAAATGLLPERLVSDPDALSFELRLLREARRVGDAEGVRWTDLPGFPVRLLVRALALPDRILRPLVARRLAGGRGGKPPSLWLDMEAGRPLEADALYGSVVRLAGRHGLVAPAHDALLQALARRASDPGRTPVPLPEILEGSRRR